MNRRILPWILIYTLWMILGAYLYHHYSAIHNDVEENMEAAIFTPSSFTLGEDTSYLDEKIETYNQSDQSVDIRILGKYTADESNTSIYPNLGLARALHTRNYLMENQIFTEQIELASQQVSELVRGNEIELKFIPEASPSRHPDADKVREPIHLYIDYTTQDIRLNEGQRQALYDVARFLEVDKRIVLMVSGHTESGMDEMQSLSVSNNNALFVANVLRKNGISDDRMSIVARGFSDPIAENDTEEGKKANRRITIQLKGKK